jgi:hypothetical protein
MRSAVPVSFLPSAFNHLSVDFTGYTYETKKISQVRFLSLAEDIQACDVRFWECDAIARR